MSKFEWVIHPPGHVESDITLGTGWFWAIKNDKGKVVAHAAYKLSSKEECKDDFEKFKNTFLQSFSK